MRVALDSPRGFDFRRTVRSHGWAALAPFDAPADTAWLDTVVDVSDGPARPIRLRPAPGRGVVLESPGRVPHAERTEFVAAARRILGLDLDLTAFYATARDRRDTAWMAEGGRGRLLRCPTAWEDLVKLILTTNCSWALTIRMTRSLVERWGAPVGGRDAAGRRAFPGPERLAGVRESAFRAAGLGYRSARLAELTRLVRRGDIDPDAWADEPRNAAERRAAILAAPGAGPYVADNVLRLDGRPDGLGLDSSLRASYARVYHGGRRVADRTIARRYAWFGRWGGLALWCDMTRDRADEGH